MEMGIRTTGTKAEKRITSSAVRLLLELGRARILEFVGARIRRSRRFAKNVVITSLESRVIPGSIVWEDWNVNPDWISVDSNGDLRVRWMEHIDLYELRVKNGSERYLPLRHERWFESRAVGRWMSFRNHPHVKGIVFLGEPDQLSETVDRLKAM